MSIDRDDNIFTSLPDDMDKYTAAGVGPGLGTDEKSVAALKDFLSLWNKPLVLDADALNMIAMNKEEMLPMLKPNTIITPHVKEFRRWVGDWADDFDRLEKQLQLAMHYGIVVVLKGANTSVCCPDGKVYFNSTGNPGMATGGSGDVLTGILLALLAIGYSPLDACRIGVYVHGLAGDIACEKLSEISLMAGDIVEALPQAWKQLLN